jgi:hypothetical protein
VSPPLDLDAIRERARDIPGASAGWVLRVERSAQDVPALLARLDEAEELARALEAAWDLSPGWHRIARDALARWRGTADG